MPKVYAVTLEDLIIGIFDNQEDATACVQDHVAADEGDAVIDHDGDGNVVKDDGDVPDDDGDVPDNDGDVPDGFDPFDVYDGVGQLGRYLIIEMERNRDYFPLQDDNVPMGIITNKE
jgi:hypothetical protein